MPHDDDPGEVHGHLNTPSPRWYEGLPEVSGEVECGAEKHRITWRRGKVVLEDHDVLAEQSLAALGGQPPMCLQILEAWRAMGYIEILSDLLVKDAIHSPEVFASMKATHKLRMARARATTDRRRAQLRTQPRGGQERSHLERQGGERLEREKRWWGSTLIKDLPPALRRALALSMLVNVERHWDDEDFRREHAKHVEAALTAVATPLFDQSARRWKRNFKPYARVVAEASLLAPGELPRCTGRANSEGAHAALALPISWFIDIWARDIALVDHTFVMGQVESVEDETGLHVLAVRWERQGWENSSPTEAPAVLTRGRRGEWRLYWQ